jgi:hypothetical protein
MAGPFFYRDAMRVPSVFDQKRVSILNVAVGSTASSPTIT